jgi:thiosulfate dehydrogenase (quinone) large subunit
MTERFPLAYLFPLRVLFGVILVLEGWSKLQGDWLHGTPLANTLGNWLAADKPYGFFVPMVKLAHAHPKIFGSLVTIGEVAVGLSLLAGVLTRIGAALGALMLFGFALGNGQGLVPPGNALIMAVVCVLFVAAPPGRFLGVDAALVNRLPRWMV